MSDIKVGIKLTTDGSGKVTAEITKITGGLSTMGKAGAESSAKLNSSFSTTRSARLPGCVDQTGKTPASI